MGANWGQGQGNALHVQADKPVGATQRADGDGNDATVFLAAPFLGTAYGIPVDAQYIAIACPSPNTNVTLTDGTNVSNGSCSASGDVPGKLRFGLVENGVGINAGAYLESNQPIYVMYEPAATNDEHNLIGN